MNEELRQKRVIATENVKFLTDLLGLKTLSGLANITEVALIDILRERRVAGFRVQRAIERALDLQFRSLETDPKVFQKAYKKKSPDIFVDTKEPVSASCGADKNSKKYKKHCLNENANFLIGLFGQAHFASIANIPQATVSAISTRRRNVGYKVANAVEERLCLRDGSLELDPSVFKQSFETRSSDVFPDKRSSDFVDNLPRQTVSLSGIKFQPSNANKNVHFLIKLFGLNRLVSKTGVSYMTFNFVSNCQRNVGPRVKKRIENNLRLCPGALDKPHDSFVDGYNTRSTDIFLEPVAKAVSVPFSVIQKAIDEINSAKLCEASSESGRGQMMDKMDSVIALLSSLTLACEA